MFNCIDGVGRLSALAVVLALMVPALPSWAEEAALAEEAGAVDARVEYVDRLGSEDYHERIAAQRALLRDDSLELDDLEGLFAHAESLEQYHRLMDVARHHVLRLYAHEHYAEPGAGSLGIAHETVHRTGIPEWRRPAVKVLRTLVGLPGYAVLQPGDLILSFEDQWLPQDASRQHFGQMIANYDMGDTVKMTVYRDGQMIDLEVELASLVALQQMFHPQTMQLADEMQQAWQEQRESFAGHFPEATRLSADVEPSEAQTAENEAVRVRTREDGFGFRVEVRVEIND